MATFGAGQTVAVGQLALANFNNPKGLVKIGSNRYGESQAAGIANVGDRRHRRPRHAASAARSSSRTSTSRRSSRR